MSTLTTAELSAQVETDLATAALQAIIDAAEAEIDEHIGAASNMVVEYDGPGLLNVITLPKRATTIDSVKEYSDDVSDPTITTLAADDYQLSDDGWTLRRLSDGTNPGSVWGYHVVIQMDEATDTARRKQATIELCKLLVASGGYESETVGDWSGTLASKGMAARRAEILESLDGLAVT